MEDLTQTPHRADEAPRRRSGLKLLVSAVILGLVGVVAGVGTWSAFSDTTENGGNSFQSGTVRIGDDDNGSALFNLSGLTPSSTPAAQCIVVDYTGTSDANVRLYGATGGTGLDEFINLKVTRGTTPDPRTGCTEFDPDAADHQGDGAGVIYDGTLRGFRDDFATADQEPAAGTPETWTTGEKHAYKFEVLLQSDDDAQGLSATQTFTWEARNTPIP